MLQLVLPRLARVESEQTLHFLQTFSRHNKVQIDVHSYILGQSMLVAIPDQKDLLNMGRIKVFSRLYMQGHLYTSRSYLRRLQGKRNNVVCVFKTSSNICAAMAILILWTVHLLKLLFESLKLNKSILQQAGPPCRRTLAIYKEVDLLNNYITRVARNGPLVAAALKIIISKAVLVNKSETLHAIMEPNLYEHH